MAQLGITRRNLPAAVQIIVKSENNVSPLTLLTFGGKFSVSQQTKVITHLTLQSSGLRRQGGKLTLRLPIIESKPEMPEWRKEMP